MTLVHLKTPLPDGKLAVLTLMDRVARQVNLRYLVVGATARDILMYYLHGFPLNRASPDIDFAVAIESWSAFTAFKAALLREPPLRSDARIPYRLHYSVTVDDGFPVDLVPFGGVEISPAQVAWPPDMAIVMNVAGYAEALDSAVTVYVADDCEIPVASIPGLVMTKLIAWLDRGQSNPKDAVDFRYLLENYADAGNADRLYGEELPLLHSCGYQLSMLVQDCWDWMWRLSLWPKASSRLSIFLLIGNCMIDWWRTCFGAKLTAMVQWRKLRASLPNLGLG